MLKFSFSNAQISVCIAFHYLTLLAGSKQAVSANIKTTVVQIGLDACSVAAYKTKCKILHVAMVMKDFTLPQCKDYKESIKHV